MRSVTRHEKSWLSTTARSIRAEAANTPCCRERPPAAATLHRFADLRVFDLRRGRFWFKPSSAVAASSCAPSGPACCEGLGADCASPTVGRAAVCWLVTCAATRRTHAPRLASEPAARMPPWHRCQAIHIPRAHGRHEEQNCQNVVWIDQYAPSGAPRYEFTTPIRHRQKSSPSARSSCSAAAQEGRAHCPALPSTSPL